MRKVLAVLPFMAALAARAEDAIVIAAPPSSTALVSGLTTAYGGAFTLGVTVLGCGLVIWAIRRGVKAR